MLTGNILTSGVTDVAAIAPLYLAIGALHCGPHAGAWHSRAPAGRAGRAGFWNFFFYATFGVVVTSSVALAGVLLVFSFLIIPAAIGML